MPDIKLVPDGSGGLSPDEINAALGTAFGGLTDRKFLLIVPDHTRKHSYAGIIANRLYHLLCGANQVDLLTALGTHIEMTSDEIATMYGDIPLERFFQHNWRTGVETLGVIPRERMSVLSEGWMDEAVEIAVNRHIVSGGYDHILSIGQVVPHEVAGMANHNKNIFVGCGGSAMINASHMLGAAYGMERIMGQAETPVRALFNEAETRFLRGLPISYILTVTTAAGDDVTVRGLFAGEGRECFAQAAETAAAWNLNAVQSFRKVVVYLDPAEFHSTWLGNKAIYRTRMAIADGGELVVLAPGVDRFGEDNENDRLIRKYGYTGREHILSLLRDNEELQANRSAAAHLIHGSSDGRFAVTYCTRYLDRAAVEGVGFGYLAYDEAVARYNPDTLQNGYNTLADGEEIYYISNPALGLWTAAK